jgi:hypothetical protein
MPKEDQPPGQKPEGEKAPVLARKTQEVILPELLETIRQEGAHVDINVLLVQLGKRGDDPGEFVVNAEKILEVAQKYEDRRVENFKRMAHAIIEVKLRDPDEVEKRRNNGMRRFLKGVIGGCAVVGLGGGIAALPLGASIVTIGALLSVGVLALAMCGPLATGESMSSNDVVRIMNAMRTMFSGRREDGEGDAEEEEKPPPRQRRKRSRR